MRATGKRRGGKGARKSTRARTGAGKKTRSKAARTKRAGARKGAKAAARTKTARKSPARRKAATKKAGASKSPARKTTARKVTARKTAARKVTRRSPPSARKEVFGEGNYTASREFRRDETNFVRRNRKRIPKLGENAEQALEGPEGKDLEAAEDEARSHSHSPDEDL